MLTNKVSVTSLEAEQSSVTQGFFEKIVEGFCGKTSGQPPYSKGGVRLGRLAKKGIPYERGLCKTKTDI